jgi:Tfp pilus assembly protein FimT
MKGTANVNSQDGFATVDFLIVAVIVLIVATSAFNAIMRAQRAYTLEGAAQQFASYMEQARSDSMRRRATDVRQMAEVTIINAQFYSVRMDEDGDGSLDVPRVVNLQEQQLTVDGPYPRTFMFDRAGKSVDTTGNANPATAVAFANRSAKSIIKISDSGKTSREK